jgi:DivIVA domain-containing protein
VRLSPLDVRHMEFDRGAMGYRHRAVREFLERLADEFEDLLREVQTLRDRVAKREAVIEELRATEAELKRAVVAAERIGNEMKEQARREADAITREARRERLHVLQDTAAALETARAELARLEQTQALVREQLRGHLTGFLTALDARPGGRSDAAGSEDVIASLREAIEEARAALRERGERFPDLQDEPAASSSSSDT